MMDHDQADDDRKDGPPDYQVGFKRWLPLFATNLTVTSD